MKQTGSAYLFMSPLLVCIIGVLGYPIILTLWMSFRYYYLVRPAAGHPFVGVKNYLAIFQSSTFLNSLKVTFILLSTTVIGRFALGLGSALLLNRKFRGRTIARVAIIIPWCVPVVVAALTWVQMYNSEFGIINQVLQTLGVLNTPRSFLGDLSLALPAVIVVWIWKGFGFVTIMLLAGLQSIPLEMYEAAKVDGASSWQRFLYITFPMLSPVSLITILLLVIWTMRQFALPWVLTYGGPAHATEVLAINVYFLGFRYFRMGHAAAAAMILAIFSLIFTIIYMRGLKVGRGY